ncbi:MAG TPA: DM13 domain-containing protein [Chryseolinea sp.]|nr:DM13 domain-containing protein [Chryseolinea sp.]
MKIFFFICALLISISCSEDDNTPTAPVDDQFDPDAMQVMLLKQGIMTGAGGHTVSGTVKVYDDDGKKVIVLDPFTSQNGPDLKVYLSKDENATQYLNLGALKSTMGKQSYDVSGMPDLEQYKFVLIWCQEFSVLFGEAELSD